MKAYRVTFKFPDTAMLHIVAKNVEEAVLGAKQMVEKKMPDAYDFSAEEVEDEPVLPFDAGIPTDNDTIN